MEEPDVALPRFNSISQIPCVRLRARVSVNAFVFVCVH